MRFINRETIKRTLNFMHNTHLFEKIRLLKHLHYSGTQRLHLLNLECLKLQIWCHADKYVPDGLFYQMYKLVLLAVHLHQIYQETYL